MPNMVPCAALLGALALGSASAEAATSWTVSRDAAEGCNTSGERSVCLVVRCDAPGRLNTYFQVVEGDPFSDGATFVIDGRRLPVTVAPPVVHDWGTAYTIGPKPSALVAALAGGRRLVIQGAILTGGFNVFSLAGADRAIGTVRQTCARPPRR